MPLIRIQSYPGVRQVFIASEEISHLAVIAINETGPRYVELGTNADQAKVCGVAYGAVSGIVSGQVIRAVTQGIVSGVALATDVLAGDRVTCASAGLITPINTITPAGAISGYIPAGATGLTSGIQAASGVISGFATIATPSIFSSGAIVGTAFNTARVLGKALASGFVLSGHTVPILVCLGG